MSRRAVPPVSSDRPREGGAPPTVLAAYFDDCRGEGVHAIAGYMAPLKTWEERFSPEWNAIIAAAPHPISEFKAHDCRFRINEFAGWTRAECDALTVQLVDLLTRPEFTDEIYGLGSVVRVPLSENVAERTLAEREALKIGVLCVTTHVLMLSNPAYPVQVTCDEQPGWQGALSEIFAFAREPLVNHRSAKISELVFKDSRDLAPLQAADLLAYETRKELLNRLEQPPRNRSKALARLIERGRHVAYYVDREILSGVTHPHGPLDRPRLLYSDPRMTLPDDLTTVPLRRY